MMVVGILVNPGAGPSLVNEDFLPFALRKSMETIKSLLLGTANRKLLFVEGIMRLFVHMDDLRVHAWFGVVKILAVDVLLWTSFINFSIRENFPIRTKFPSCGILEPWR